MYVNFPKESDTMSDGSKSDITAKKRVRALFEELLDWINEIIKMLVIAVLMCTFVVRPARVEGSSMLPTLVDKDMIILWNLCYEPRQGDIIAANSYNLPNADGTRGKIIVKRIIAVGGQEINIDFDEGKVYVDGELFEVVGLANITTDRESNYDYPLTVPDGKYFVMGDNRQHSTDSRSALVGFIDRDDILGKAVFRIYPFYTAGSLYSNRD